MNSQTNNQFEQVEDFDTDDSDLSLTPALRPYNRNHQRRDTSCTTPNLVSSSQTPEFDYCAETVRIIPSPAGIEIEDVGDDDDDDDFTRGSWVSAVEYVNGEGDITSGSFGDMKTNCQNGKLAKVVVVIKSCMHNALGDHQVRFLVQFITKSLRMGVMERLLPLEML
ncbi:hypothetical protein Tco_1237375 [Tanacetum coccineum]